MLLFYFAAKSICAYAYTNTAFIDLVATQHEPVSTRYMASREREKSVHILFMIIDRSTCSRGRSTWVDWFLGNSATTTCMVSLAPECSDWKNCNSCKSSKLYSPKAAMNSSQEYDSFVHKA